MAAVPLHAEAETKAQERTSTALPSLARNPCDRSACRLEGLGEHASPFLPRPWGQWRRRAAASPAPSTGSGHSDKVNFLHGGQAGAHGPFLPCFCERLRGRGMHQSLIATALCGAAMVRSSVVSAAYSTSAWRAMLSRPSSSGSKAAGSTGGAVQGRKTRARVLTAALGHWEVQVLCC